MPHISGHHRLPMLLAVVVLGVLGTGSPAHASLQPGDGAGGGTPLPPGWETCVLQGVGAPGTEDNVANLDEWQTAEGGSTDNAAAFNPFNTRQVADASGTPLPAAIPSGGFPAFPTWTAGCAATVATLLQPNMAPIVTALKNGTVFPPGLFLFDVDQSQWCAPSADGIPCYASEIVAGELLEVLLSGGSGQLPGALTSFADTGTDLRSYQLDAASTAADQALLSQRTAQLGAAESEVTVAQDALSRTTHAFRQLAIDDYTADGLTRSDSNLALFDPPDEQGLIAQYFGTIATSLLIDRFDHARVAVRTSISNRQAADASVAQATSLLDSATVVENEDLSKLEADVKNVEAGLSCTAPPLAPAAVAPVVDQGGAGLLWTALQGCLAPAAQSVPSPSESVP